MARLVSPDDGLGEILRAMSGISVRRRVAKFDVGYVERNRIFIWFYPRALASHRLRGFAYQMPLSRFAHGAGGPLFSGGSSRHEQKAIWNRLSRSSIRTSS